MGRKKLSDQTKSAKGTLRKARINDNELIPENIRSIPHAPAYFNETALNKWNHLIKVFMNRGLLSSLDLTAFEMLVVNLGMYEECLQKLFIEGIVNIEKIKGHEVRKLSPYWTVKKGLEERLVKLFSEFGLTPASRAGVTVISSNNKMSLQDKINMLKSNEYEGIFD